MKRYKILNNTLGWLVFIVAAVTYLLTMEPTASFWDCPEFISQGYKLEVGHPPGNPIFMLTARFFVNFAPDPSKVAMCVNAMSALLSAATILLLFWTSTHLVRRLIVKDDTESVSLWQMLVIFGSGACGALVYTWSDTFWFSAVEAEVYAFSSFCTAMVFWLILKWEDRADEPHSDRYLVLIAYVIGVSIAVHLLNLLCIPAIVLVFYYKKFKNTNVKGSLVALLISFAIIALILYGLVPGFVEVSQVVERFSVNALGMSYNTGVLIYAIADIAVFVWCMYELYKQQSITRIKLSFFLSILLSGIPFIGDGWILPIVIMLALAIYLFVVCSDQIPTRILTVIVMGIFVIFVGYSSYALILVRSNTLPPMDQNSPDNVFSLSSYLNREQYGDSPLFYGRTYNSVIVYQANNDGAMKPLKKEGKTLYSKVAKVDESEPDHYKEIGTDDEYITSPELNMLFPRMHSSAHAREYAEWVNIKGRTVAATTQLNTDGSVLNREQRIKPTMAENLSFFIDYQLNYMYWRYFMWNFVGRQNDIQGSGEITHGNWISGIPVIDNWRLGDQSLLPPDLSTQNKAHNVFYMLPLLLGIIGLLWQAFSTKRGIEQFWVIFFLFFMTGIAIVIYLNQTPNQPRERDYAYAGSFYAFSIWVGMGVAGLWNLLRTALSLLTKRIASTKENVIIASVAALVGLAVPLQMVSQTWDDHDRSGRYPARDFGMNYLSSVDENGIIFTNGDNDTFPLWYCQEVEGYRTDVRVVNLSYLTTDWYIQQMRRPAYESAPLPMLAPKTAFAYEERQYSYFIDTDDTPTPALESLAKLYSDNYKDNMWHLATIKNPVMYIPVDSAATVRAGVVSERNAHLIRPRIECNMYNDRYTASEGAMSSSKVMTLDIIASSIAEGWSRPIYFASTVPESYYLGLTPWLQTTGLAQQLTPIYNPDYSSGVAVNSEKMYDVVMNKFRWAGVDQDQDGHGYWDETITRMVSSTRNNISDLALQLIEEGEYEKAADVLNLMDQKLPIKAIPYGLQLGQRIAQIYEYLGTASDNPLFIYKAADVLYGEIERYAYYVRYYQSLDLKSYNRLSNTDKYIDVYYFGDLIEEYCSLSDDNKEKVIELAENIGVNLRRVLEYRNAARRIEQANTEKAKQSTREKFEEAAGNAGLDLNSLDIDF